MSQQKILVADFAGSSGIVPNRPGQRPFTKATQGGSLQQMAGAAGKGGDWQGIAAANSIEDPLRMAPGALIDLDASVSIGASASISPPSVSASAAVSLSAPSLSIS